jgi:hypothetical protein
VYWIALVVLVMALIAVRVPNLVAVESAFAAGKTSKLFHPDFNRMAQLAAAKAGEAVFVAADWGAATQIYCVGNGQSDLVYELYSGSEPGASVIKLMKETTKTNVYVLVTGIAPEFAAASASILQAMATAPDWQEAPVEAEFAVLQGIDVRKFVRQR